MTEGQNPGGLDPTVTFFADGLLSKWGFGDGDMLDDLLWDHGFGQAWRDERALRPESEFSFDHRVLIRTVEEHVIPVLRQHHDVSTFRIHTIHNPIRADSVDGIRVEHPNDDRHLLSECVEVPVAVILSIAAEEAARYTS